MSIINNNLKEIVNINIDISRVSSVNPGYGNILLVVNAPDTLGDKPIADVLMISRAAELQDYGYKETDQAYIAAKVAFLQDPAPVVLYLAIRKMVDGSPESMTTVLNRANESGGWYGIALSSEFKVKEELEAVVEWTENNEKLFGFTYTDSINLPIDTVDCFRSFAFYAGDVPDSEVPAENKYAALALMAKCFCYQSGSETWALKSLNGISPSKLTETKKRKLENLNVTYYSSYTSKNITNATGGKVLANEWIDTIRFRDWLQNDMRERIFMLLVSQPKLPFTDGGITAIQSKMEESLKIGQEAGGIAPTEYDNDDKEVAGYTTSVPKSIDLTESQKASRRLTGCKFSARMASAIQVIEVNGNLNY